MIYIIIIAVVAYFVFFKKDEPKTVSTLGTSAPPKTSALTSPASAIVQAAKTAAQIVSPTKIPIPTVVTTKAGTTVTTSTVKPSVVSKSPVVKAPDVTITKTAANTVSAAVSTFTKSTTSATGLTKTGATKEELIKKYAV